MKYLDYKHEFIKKHGKSDWRCETSPMASDGSYHKEYIFGDGAVLYEINSPVFEEARASATVRGIEVVLTDKVKLFRTEAWNTDDATSQFFYEKW